MSLTDQIRQWWNFKHYIGDNIVGNSDLTTVTQFLQLEQKIKDSIQIAEIGIGTGNIIKTLYNIGGKLLTAVDISPFALMNVEQYAITCLPHEMRNWKKGDASSGYDLIICYLLAQHVTDPILLRLFLDSIKALKNDGIFAIQAMNVDNGKNAVSMRSLQTGSILRSPKELEDIINAAGGKVSSRIPNKQLPNTPAYWYGLHAKRIYSNV